MQINSSPLHSVGNLEEQTTDTYRKWRAAAAASISSCPWPMPRSMVLVQGGHHAPLRGARRDAARPRRVRRPPGTHRRGALLRGVPTAAPHVVAAAPVGERLVLVGHSFGGLSLSLAMERFPEKIAAAVFVAAAMPCVGKHIGITTELMRERSPKDLLMDSKTIPISNKQGPGTAILLGPNFLAENGYQLSPAEDLTLAKSLVRPANLFVDDPMMKDDKMLTSANYGSVKKVYLIAMEDSGVELMHYMIALSPGTEVEEIPGADHAVMCSRPRELSDLLAKIGSKYD
uniref:AB hydrolase-1 domain-containing protein n=1 Tax=Oryza punctata TaxID=4537 RepID=A0A0E0JS61_ORYPU